VGADGGLANSLEAHRKYLLRYALFQLRDASLAEDAVQDTLVAALAQGEGFQGRSQLRTWLNSVPIVSLRRRSAALISCGPEAGATQQPHQPEEWAECSCNSECLP
jgi:hypothetical protein